MSRFNNLEMNNEFENFSSAETVLKDEAFYMKEAQAAFERGRFEPALRSFARVLEHNPQNAAAWTGQVRMLIELAEFHEARLWADKALEQFPKEPELLAAKAVALGRLGDLKSALAFSDASVEERGNTPYIWLARGDVLLARKEKMADYCFEKAFLAAPLDWTVAWLASRIHLFYQKFSIALKMAQRAMSLNTSLAVIWLQMARCQLAVGLPDIATHSFEQARELDPQSTEAEKGLREISNLGFWSRINAFWHQMFQR